MRKYYIFLLTIIIGLVSHSCLDLDPKDQLAETNLWQRPNDFKLFANQFYGWTRDFSSSVYDAPHSDKRSDIILDSNDKNNVYRLGTNGLTETDNDYNDAYKRIRRTNLLLKNAETYAKQVDIAQYIGEARFFRAYCYYDLLQLFGDVIVTDKPLDITDPELYVARNNRSEVVDFMIADLQDAALKLPATASVENGRIGSEGALSFLSRVALYEGTWQKSRGNTARGKELLDIAAKAAKQVIDSRNFELFKPAILGDSVQKYMFILEDVKSNPAGLQKSANKEYIFARRHDETLSPIGKNITKECLINVQQVSRKFVNMYLCDNGLPIEYNSTTNPRFQGYTKIDSEFQNRDNRMRYTLARPHDTFWSNENPRVTWSGDEADLASASIKDFKPGSGSGYANQKWSTERKVNTNYEGYDYPIIRYAEVLLNYAEALFERDDAISDQDLDISLNLVRLRVNSSMPKLSNDLVSVNGLNMRTEIRRERTIELYNEGFRIDDLKRWKTAETEMPMDFIGIKWEGTEFQTVYSNPGYSRNAEGCLIIENGRKWAEKNYLYPIPADQKRLNPNLGQNPGWGN